MHLLVGKDVNHSCDISLYCDVLVQLNGKQLLLGRIVSQEMVFERLVGIIKWLISHYARYITIQNDTCWILILSLCSLVPEEYMFLQVVMIKFMLNVNISSSKATWGKVADFTEMRVVNGPVVVDQSLDWSPR